MTLHFIHWDVNPEIVNIMGFSLRYYGLLFAGGIMLCLVLLKWIFKKENISSDKLDTLTIYGVAGIFIGARLGHCLFYDFAYFQHHLLEMFLPIQQTEDGGYKFTGFLGLASHGGVLGLILAVIVYSKITKESLLKTFDLISVVAPLEGFFIRLANLMNSEMIGFPTNVPWAFIFESEDPLPRHPAQLYEAIAYLLIFFVTFYLYQTNRPKLQNGFFFGIALSSIFIARFFIEFVKERQVSFEEQMPFDMGQLLSIPFILIGLGFVVHGLTKPKKDKEENELQTTVEGSAGQAPSGDLTNSQP